MFCQSAGTHPSSTRLTGRRGGDEVVCGWSLWLCSFVEYVVLGRTCRFGGCGPVKLLQLFIQSALLAAALWLGHRFHHEVEVEAAGLLARREFAEALQPLRDVSPGGANANMRSAHQRW